MLRRVATVLIVGGLMVSGALAQAPQGKSGSLPDASLFPPIPTDPAHPDYHAGAHRSIVRHNPLPRTASYRSYYQGGRTSSSSSSSGYANPGGVGRFSEYYDANTPTSQVDQHPVPVAKFDSGGGPTRADQISAAQVGQQRARNIQDNINAYGRPYGAYGAGFGYGLGLSGGVLYPY